LARMDPTGVLEVLTSDVLFRVDAIEVMEDAVAGLEPRLGGCGKELILTVLRRVLSGMVGWLLPSDEFARIVGSVGVEED
jgi:hypothetical protein